MSENAGHEEEPREHSEQPAEGDRTRDPADTGAHAQDPAEGTDPDPGESGTSRN
jgi:hypothetical protein